MKKERIGLIIINGLLLAVATFFFSSCMTYRKAVRKFGHMATDSTTIVVRDTVTIPKDSIVTQFKTDTTFFHRVYETVRTKLTVNRTPKETSITAECKPDTFYREIPAKCPPAVTFGVDPAYKEKFERWRTIAYSLIALIVVGIIVYVFTYHYKLRTAISISRR